MLHRPNDLKENEELRKGCVHVREKEINMIEVTSPELSSLSHFYCRLFCWGINAKMYFLRLGGTRALRINRYLFLYCGKSRILHYQHWTLSSLNASLLAYSIVPSI